MSTHSIAIDNIPQPKEKLLVGNLFELGSGTAVQNMMRLARTYGPIYQLTLPGRHLLVVSGYDLVKELSDEKRFDKKIWAPLQNVRSFSGDGLFTSWTHEENWHKAHNILLSNFGTRAMQGYLPMMVDIAEQLVGKWDRLNTDDEIDVPGDMTRLTLDTIGLCGFDYRFNSFYREDMHPFVKAMVGALSEAMQRGRRLPIEDKLLIHKRLQFQADVELMNSTVDRIIRERKESGEDQSQKKDLLGYMLSGIDRKSGGHLDDQNIRYQIITFLIAGHETTSGLLSFAIYQLLHHPEVLASAYEEIDRVLGHDLTATPTMEQIQKLRYLSQILHETLRLWPTAPAYSVYPLDGETTIGNGRYKITNDVEIAILIPMLHRDTSIWGEDVDTFNPDRFSPEEEQKRPADAFKPFGNGQRACIGRQFALQEATLVLGMLLQRYKFIDHTNYQFKIKETLTLKPDNFKIKVEKRKDSERTIVTPTQEGPQIKLEAPQQVAPKAQLPKHYTPLLVLFGSNTGTAEELARRIAQDGEAYGFTTMVAALDDYTHKLPTDGAVVIVTASYNGNPPDNAEAFCNWIVSPDSGAHVLSGVKYTVFGCGNRDWAGTYQNVPILVDQHLERLGAQRIYQRGEGDSRQDMEEQFEAWYQPLWKNLFQSLSMRAQLPESTSTISSTYQIEVINMLQSNPLLKTLGARPTRIAVNHELQHKEGTHPAERSTRHIEIELPEGVAYETGGHLGIIPRNNDAQIDRIARHFNFTRDTYIKLHRTDQRKSNIPLDTPISIYSLLSEYAEIQDVATRKQLRVLAEYTQCPPEKIRLQALCGDDEASIARFKEVILTKRRSLIDLLEECPACELPFNVYLEMLPPMRPRYFSISSSPRHDERHCSITVGVVDAPAKSGHGQFQGVASNYLLHQQENSFINAFIQNIHSPFMLPENPDVPVIMIGPGTGVAPFRGFLQERAAQKAQGISAGPALLFFGCRHPEQDYIYQDEFEALARDGVMELYPAFSRWKGHQKTYVQDQILAQQERVWELIQQGAIIYICGDASHMAPDVRKTFMNLYREKTGTSLAEAEAWLQEQGRTGHYLVDVWPE